MLKPVLNRNAVLACCADCPFPSTEAAGNATDNQARRLALFL